MIFPNSLSPSNSHLELCTRDYSVLMILYFPLAVVVDKLTFVANVLIFIPAKIWFYNTPSPTKHHLHVTGMDIIDWWQIGCYVDEVSDDKRTNDTRCRSIMWFFGFSLFVQTLVGEVCIKGYSDLTSQIHGKVACHNLCSNYYLW